MRARLLGPLALATLVLALGGNADAKRFRLDPGASEIHFALGATLHTVRGSFSLRGGELVVDEGTGSASGRIVIDAASGRTGNESRDRAMHERVLRSDEFPEIVFHAEALDDTSLAGALEIVGARHPVSIAYEQSKPVAGRLEIIGRTRLPYVAWGLEDVSTFVLRVDKSVDVELRVVGVVSSADGEE